MTTHLKAAQKGVVSMWSSLKETAMRHFLQNQVSTSTLVLLVIFSLGMAESAHAGVRIETPVVIPKDAIPEKNNTVRAGDVPAVPQSQPGTVEQKTELAPSTGSTSTSETIVVPTPLEPEFAFASASTSFANSNASELTSNSPSGIAKNNSNSPQQREKEEMYTRMRMAVERIASEYGNPTFGQFFTNDKLQAQVIRNRLQLLQKYEALLAEIATLEKKKNMAAQAVDATSRQRMEQLKLEIRVLEDRKKLVADEVKTEIARQKRELSAEITTLENKKKEIERETAQGVAQQKAVIQAETEALTREKKTLEMDVSSQKNELKTLKEQSSLLRERIIKAQKALSLVESGE